MKKISMYSLLILSMVVIAVLISINFRMSKEAKSIIAVNGEAVDEREIQLILNRQKASVYDYFQKKYGARDSKKFWTTSFQGEVPQEKAKQQAMDELTKTKVQQLLSKEYGLSEDVSYSAFLITFQKENDRRRTAISKKEVIYGPTQFDEATYYDYFLSNMISDVKKLLAQKEWTITDMVLQKSFDELRDRYYKKADTMRIERVGLSFLDDSNIVDEKKKKEALSILEQLKKGLSAEQTFKQAATLQAIDQHFHLIQGEQIFDEKSFQQDYRMYGELLATAEKLSVGEVSDVVVARDNYCYLIQLVEKANNGYQDFSSVKDQVRTRYIDQKYEELLEERMKQAHIDINQSEWKSLEVH